MHIDKHANIQSNHLIFIDAQMKFYSHGDSIYKIYFRRWSLKVQINIAKPEKASSVNDRENDL